MGSALLLDARRWRAFRDPLCPPRHRPSVTYEPGRTGYTDADLVADACGVLDTYGLPATHIVGASAGGAFAQSLALDAPGRVLSLALISTSPAVPVERELPPPTEKFGRFFCVDRAGGQGRRRLADRLRGRVLAGARGNRVHVRRGGGSRSRAPRRRARPRHRRASEPRRHPRRSAAGQAAFLDRGGHP